MGVQDGERRLLEIGRESGDKATNRSAEVVLFRIQGESMARVTRLAASCLKETARTMAHVTATGGLRMIGGPGWGWRLLKNSTYSGRSFSGCQRWDHDKALSLCWR